MIRLDRAAGLACTIAGLLLVTGFLSPGPAIAAGPAGITDPAGDTINRDTNAKLTAAAADIVAASVDSGAGGIVLSFRTASMANPATDPGWASGNTSASWQLDENGDGKIDDIVSYSTDPTAPGSVVGDLTHWPGQNQPAQHCSPAAGFDPAAGYTLTVDPACVGKPTALSYRVQVTYDTSPGAKKPPLAFDIAPDQGLAGPVPIAEPTAPAAAPPPAGASAPPPAAPGAGAAPPPSSAPAPGAKPGTPPATKAPKAATPSTTAAKRPAAPTAAQPNPAPAPPPAGLAATGADSRPLGALGGLLLLLGGLTLILRPRARPVS